MCVPFAGAFLCEMGWCKDGMLILEKIYTILADNPDWYITEMALDCAYR